MLTLIWSTARPSLRRPGLACIGATASIGLLCFVQESAALRRMGLRFGWESCRDALVVALLCFCVMESAGWGRARVRWEIRTATSRTIYTLQRILAVLFGLVFVGTTSCVSLFAAERILIPEADGLQAWSCLIQALTIALPLAAWTPGLGALATRADLPGAVVFGVFAALSCGVLGVGVPLPLDRLPAVGDGRPLGQSDMLPAILLSTAAGLCVTAALTPGYPPQSTSCGSASSATSTATSKR